MQKITILGSTGSIGVNTLNVVACHPDQFQVFALTGNSRLAELADQCLQFNPRYAVVPQPEAADELRQLLFDRELATEVLHGVEGLSAVAADPRVDSVMAAIVGAAGLLPTMAAVRAGKRVLLANKEALVMAGKIFMDAVKESGATLLPIDSEHNAIFQCLPGNYRLGDDGAAGRAGVRKIILSASGGPFRTTPVEELEQVTPAQACAHPNWEMGRKISVDSATMMNKGLELIEACWLFGVTPDKVEVLLHPQSVIHSMVEYVDGSVLAQLGNPDMRTPIAHALGWPERIESGVGSLDMIATARLDFEAADLSRFPCLELAIVAAKKGGDAPVVLNAANEVAVEAFLQERLGFGQIARVVGAVLEQSSFAEPLTLDEVQASDLKARLLAAQLIQTI